MGADVLVKTFRQAMLCSKDDIAGLDIEDTPA